MKSLMRRIDRFCIDHPKFGIRNLMLYIVIGSGLVWLFGKMDGNNILINALVFNGDAVFKKFQIWRLFTFVLVPTQDGFLFLISLYFYYFIGNTLERYWGSGKFTIYYFSGMVLNILYATIFWLATNVSISINTSYLNLSMFFAFATLFPEMQVLLFFIIPIKMKWLGIANAVIFALAIITSKFPINLLPIIAILNYFIFCGGWLLDYVKPSKVKQKQKTIDFKKAAKKYNKNQAKKPYTRKCEVCGRTDTDYPDLEFRFCSRCEGYHCFCIDHINSHVHFKN
ncbi:MAG: rhomboid family intramembrane serine protease [Clostridiales bacterium]|nr:rhomboid family intramembrane serine protease [Clostridiales bacterium]